MKRFAIFLLCCLFVVATAIAGPPGSPIGGAGGGGGGTPDDDSVTSAKILDNTIANADILDSTILTGKIADNTILNANINSSAAIDATKIADGTVTSAEFQYLGDVTSAIQAQMDLKAPLASPSFTTPSLGVATATTLNTGQGAYELYAMDQNVRTTDNVVVNKLTATEGVIIGQSTDPGYTRLYEGSANGTNYVEHVAEADLGAGNTTVTWGESQVAFGALNLVTTGTLSAGVVVLDNVASPTAAQVYGSLNLVNANITVLLPTAVAGMSGCVMDSGTAHDVIVDVQVGDNVVLVGVVQAGGVGITNASGSSLGDYVCFVAAQANKWYIMGKQGTWASQ